MTENVLQKNRYKIFSVGALATFMATLDGSIVNVALPSIADDLNASVDMVAWVVLAYSLTLISLMLAFGAWTEIRGYQFSYKFGFVFFIVGSGVCSLAPSIEILITGRVVQAIGTSMFAAVGPGMVTTVFPPEERGKGIGMMVMMVSAGFMVGPPLGGLMLNIWTWHSIFLINLPIGVIGILLVYRYFKVLKPPDIAKRMRIKGAASISVALVALVLTTSFINDFDVTDIRLWGTGLISVAAFVLFARYEMNPETALIGLDVFRNRTFSSSLLAAQAHFMAAAGIMILVPFYLERIQGLKPSQVGLFLIILPILMFVLAPLSGRLSDKIGFRLLTSLGMIGVGGGQLILSGLQVGSSLTRVLVALVVGGIGVGLFSTPNSSAMMGSVPEDKRAIASGVLATNRNIGQSLGVALMATLFAYFQNQFAYLGTEQQTFVESFERVLYVSASLTGFGLIFCLVRPNRISRPTEPASDREPPDRSPAADD